jgi:hypothetical protein
VARKPTTPRETVVERATRQLGEVHTALDRLTRLRDARTNLPDNLFDISDGRDHNWMVSNGYVADRGTSYPLNFFDDRTAAETFIVVHAMLAPAIALLEEATHTLPSMEYASPQAMALAAAVNGAPGGPGE